MNNINVKKKVKFLFLIATILFFYSIEQTHSF